MGDFIQSKILPLFMRFVNTRGVRAIKDGMMFAMPLIIVGAVYLLFTSLPIPAIDTLVGNLGLKPFLTHGYTSTFNIIAVVTAVGVGYTWAKNEGFEPLSAGVISLAVFLIFIPDYVPLPNLFQADGETLIYGVIKDPSTNEVIQEATDSLWTAVVKDTEGAITTPPTVISNVAGLDKTWLAGQA